MPQGRCRAIVVVLALLSLALLLPAAGVAEEKAEEATYRKVVELCVLLWARNTLDFSPNALTELGRTLDPATLAKTAALAFTVEPSGDFTHLRVTKSSGNAQLDVALLGEIEENTPWLPPPESIGKASLSFELTLPLESEALIESVVERARELDMPVTDAIKLSLVGKLSKAQQPASIPSDYERAVLAQVYAPFAPLDRVLEDDADVKAAMDRGQTLTVTAEFTLNREGRVVGSKIAQSSGIVAVDKAVLQAISAAQPYPPAPENAKGKSLTFTVPFTFRAPPELANESLKQEYYEEVRERLGGNLSELSQAIRYENFDMERYGGGDLLELSVELTLTRSGRLEAVRVPTPSGHAALDDALIRAAREAAPYPPIPGALGLSTAIVTITFAYSLHY